MKIRTKYNIGDNVKYKDEDFIEGKICKCCKNTTTLIKDIKLKGTIQNINIRVEKDNILIEYEINNDFIAEEQVIKKLLKSKV